MVVFLFGVSISDRNFYGGFLVRCYNQGNTQPERYFLPFQANQIIAMNRENLRPLQL